MMRLVTDVEAAWLGAMIDAEGSVTLLRDKRGYCRWRISFANTEIEYISAFLRLTGIGSVTFQSRNTSFGHQPLLVWNASATADVFAIAARLALFSLKVRRISSVEEIHTIG